MTEAENDTTTKSGCASGCAWLVVGIAALAAMPLIFGDWSDSDDDEPTGSMARVMCEGFVEDRLKSPGTADFQRPTTTSTGVNTWEVSGSVDAENGFGALVRMDYVCTVKGDSGGEWTLLDLDHSQR